MDISTKGSVTWSSPSNIALVKYWGKLPGQLPKNPSLSLTLKEASSITSLVWEKKNDQGIEFDYFFCGVQNQKFNERVKKYLNSLISIFPFLNYYKLNFRSENNFPHGAGIASSASAMSSIALCLCSLADSIKPLGDNFFKKASYVARLGSGSAARSVYGGVVSWGDISQEYASQINNVHSEILSLKDAILIVDSSEKAVSSSCGHELMNKHDHSYLRFDQAKKNFSQIKEILAEGNLELMGEVVEAEALGIHAMMMTSNPPYILIKPNTLNIIEKLKEFRKEAKISICFTLDAGPNVHLLYRACDSRMVEAWIETELSQYCERWILDSVGEGPLKVK